MHPSLAAATAVGPGTLKLLHLAATELLRALCERTRVIGLIRNLVGVTNKINR